MPNLLKLVDYSNPGLRKKTAPVSFPLSAQDKQIIADMIYSIQPEQLDAAGARDRAVGMAANQWGIDKSIFLFCPSADTINDLTVVINPSYEPVVPHIAALAQQEQEWEGCFSVPLATGHIKRYTNIRVKYQNENGEVVSAELSGWPARVWQHENDHLNGILYDDHVAGKCVEKKEFKSEEMRDEFYDKVREERNNENN